MGIRFLCVNCGHKLNVKSFLAGKRGVCPQCGNGLDIPLESQISKRTPAAEAVGVASRGEALAVGRSSSAGRGPVGAKPASLPRSSPDAAPQPKAKKPLSRKSVVTVASSADGPATDSSPMVVPMRPAPSAQPVTPVASVVEVAPREPAVPDPIGEAPDAIWYIRPPSGGQYGPARGEVMRKWMGEGRVSADSLVWREGWADWCTAADVFPSLSGGVTPPVPAPTPSSDFVGSPASPTSASSAVRPRRRNSAVLAVTVVTVLGLMCVALFVALILILMK